MISVDFSNIFNVGGEGVTEGDVRLLQPRLPTLLQQIHSRKQGFYEVIDDEEMLRAIERYVRQCAGKFTSVVVLGIGGSALGTICIAQTLKHLYENELLKKKTPRLYVLDNIDPTLMRETLEVINLQKTLVVVITKSGGTPETLSQYFFFRRLMDQKKLKATKHFVFVTDPKAGLLRKIATEEGIPAFSIPENVGGRFSVLTAVGLLPAALIGVNIKKLLRGARAQRDVFLSENFETNTAFQLAAVQYLLYQNGKTINVLMPYAQKLIRLADWYRQLLAESIGKAHNRQGELVHVGLTPVNALGVTDQHSQNQLYNEGPNDKLLMFVRVNNLAKKMAIPLLRPKESAVQFLRGTSFNDLIDVEYRGTAQALTHNQRPNLTITIDSIGEEQLGGLFMLFEGSVAFLGELFDINTYDQPGVELSKNLTKKILLEKNNT